MSTTTLSLYQRLEETASRELDQAARQTFDARSRRIPLQHLTSSQEFWGMEFEITPDVFIPRPETETLVEAILQEAGRDPAAWPESLWDIGTGSGCIAIALAREFQEVPILASDISSQALKVARSNARKLGVDQSITFLQGHLLDPVQNAGWIVSNPPYIASGEIPTLEPEVRDHEPRLALDGGADGLDICRSLITRAPDCLRRGGRMFLEIGWKQAQPLKEWIGQAGLPWKMRTQKDLAGIERVAILSRL